MGCTEPSKKHLRVAATGPQPLYDMERMETHWPGIGAVVLTLASLGLSITECEDRVRKIISNKHAAAAVQCARGVDLPENFLNDG